MARGRIENTTALTQEARKQTANCHHRKSNVSLDHERIPSQFKALAQGMG